jgi:hypothetical protein
MERDQIMTKYRLIRMVILLAAAVSLGLSGANVSAQVVEGPLPVIEFLGEGPGSFTVEEGRFFVVKTYENGVFFFAQVEGPTYEAAARERVWTTDYLPGESIRLHDEGRSYGQVPAGCQVNFVQIEDNIDSRRNRFFLNGEELYLIDQGMVVYGGFTVPEAGELTLFAEDSVGIIVQLCPQDVPGQPGETPTPGVTATTSLPDEPPATPSPTAPALTATLPQPTATETLPAVTETPGQATDVSPEPSPTAVTPLPDVGASPSPSPQPDEGDTPTAVPTPGSIPTTGGGPGPGDIARIAAALTGTLALLAFAWWRLIQWWKRAG